VILNGRETASFFVGILEVKWNMKKKKGGNDKFFGELICIL